MDKLWLANLAADASDGDIRELVERYAPEVNLATIKRVEGDGNAPGAILSFDAGSRDAVGRLRLRLEGLYWKGRALRCSAMVY